MKQETNDVICNLMYSIRDCVNEGDSKTAIILSKQVTELLVLSQSKPCATTCEECKSNKDNCDATITSFHS